jgi:hypothetical protein
MSRTQIFPSLCTVSTDAILVPWNMETVEKICELSLEGKARHVPKINIRSSYHGPQRIPRIFQHQSPF